jgi:hypothetical protein
MTDLEAILASIPQDISAAIERQDEAAFKQAMERLLPGDREFVAGQLAILQAQADAEAEAWLAALPVNVRLAVIDQDAERLQAALQELHPTQADEILSQLAAVGILDEMPEFALNDQPEADLLMDEFEPLAQAVASVVKGNDSARQPMEALLADLDAQGWHLSEAVQRIWEGERDPSLLFLGLERQDRQIIQRILDNLVE